jgi:hypothetical protein
LFSFTGTGYRFGAACRALHRVIDHLQP